MSRPMPSTLLTIDDTSSQISFDSRQGSTKTSTNSTPTTINPAGYPLGPSGYLPVPQSHSTQSGAAQEKAAMVIQGGNSIVNYLA